MLLSLIFDSYIFYKDVVLDTKILLIVKYIKQNSPQ